MCVRDACKCQGRRGNGVRRSGGGVRMEQPVLGLKRGQEVAAAAGCARGSLPSRCLVKNKSLSKHAAAAPTSNTPNTHRLTWQQCVVPSHHVQPSPGWGQHLLGTAAAEAQTTTHRQGSSRKHTARVDAGQARGERRESGCDWKTTQVVSCVVSYELQSLCIEGTPRPAGRCCRNRRPT